MKKDKNIIGGIHGIKKENKGLFKEKYPVGAIIVLDKMEGEPNKSMVTGLRGVIAYVDDALGIHVNWENGSNLALLYVIDEYHLEE